MDGIVSIKNFSRYGIADGGYVMNLETKQFLSPRLNHSGYLMVGMKNDQGKYKTLKLHRLVAQYFVPPFGGFGLVVDHINREKLDNNSSNLRWVTQKENIHNTIRGQIRQTETHICTCLCGSKVVRVAV